MMIPIIEMIRRRATAEDVDPRIIANRRPNKPKQWHCFKRISKQRKQSTGKIHLQNKIDLPEFVPAAVVAVLL